MIAIFVCPFANSNAVTPPLQSDDAFHLQYPDPVTNELRGGYALIGHVPFASTCLVWFDTSEAMVDAMIAGSDYLFVDDPAEPENI